MADSTRRNILFPDDLWAVIEERAAKAGAKRKRPMSLSEWVRKACEEKAEREIAEEGR